MLNRVITAKNGIEPEMPSIIESLKEKILDLNRGQLASNTNTLGGEIGRYKQATQRILTERLLLGEDVIVKIAGDPFDFQQKGDFFNAFDLYYEQGQLELFSRDWKDPILEGKYPNIYGLTKQNAYYYNYILVKPRLIQFIKGVLYA